MGAKRKPKQVSKNEKGHLKKSNANKSTTNQMLLRQYFPNLTQKQQKAYKNVLKKPKGVMNEQKKLCKQLLTEQTVIIGEINSLFNEVFKQIDHEMINQLMGKFMTENKNVPMCQKMDNNLKSQSQASTITVNRDLVLTNQDQFSQSQVSNKNRFLFSLEEFTYTPSMFSKNEKQVNQKFRSIKDKSRRKTQTDVEITCCEQDQQKQFQKAKSSSQPQKEKENSFQQTLSIKMSFVQKQQENLSQFNISTQNKPKNILQKPQKSSKLYPFQQFQLQQKQNDQQNTFDEVKLQQTYQKIKLVIDRIMKVMEKKQQLKQSTINFKQYVSLLKKTEGSKSGTNKLVESCEGFYPSDCRDQISQQVIDSDEMTFVDMILFYDCRSKTQPFRDAQFLNQCPQKSTNQIDILDVILHRGQNIISYKQKHQQSITANSLHSYKRKQLIDKFQGRHESNIKLSLDDQSTTQKSDIHEIKQTVNTNVSNGMKFMNNQQNQTVYQRNQPQFNLPEQFLEGYSKKYMNQNFFKRIHQLETQKMLFKNSVQKNII